MPRESGFIYAGARAVYQTFYVGCIINTALWLYRISPFVVHLTIPPVMQRASPPGLYVT